MVRDVLAALDRLTRRPLWPGFEPGSVPVALAIDGDTFLLRHPSPPPEFVQLPEVRNVVMVRGLHPAIRANSVGMVAGVDTATVVVEPGPSSPRPIAALIVHEAFHHFQRQRHPWWGGNEVDGLRLSRLEVDALRRALDEASVEEATRWTAIAMALRQARFGRLAPRFVTYERQIELIEELATYVEQTALGRRDVVSIPADGFAAGDIRRRCYATGHAIATLLDRFFPGWQTRLEADDQGPLDILLTSLLPAIDDALPIVHARDRQSAMRQAETDIARLKATRVASRASFDQQPGWRLVIIAAEDEPLCSTGFDPMNIDLLGDGALLHDRYLALRNRHGSIEVLGRSALTEGTGDESPLDGARRVTLRGLPAEPRVDQNAGTWIITGDGLVVTIQPGRVVVQDDTTQILLGLADGDG